jgi:hypothetical protein
MHMCKRFKEEMNCYGDYGAVGFETSMIADAVSFFPCLWVGPQGCEVAEWFGCR